MSIDPKPERQRVIRHEQHAALDWMLEQREAIAAHIEEGFAQAERGELIDGDDVITMLRRRRREKDS